MSSAVSVASFPGSPPLVHNYTSLATLLVCVCVCVCVCVGLTASLLRPVMSIETLSTEGSVLREAPGK